VPNTESAKQRRKRCLNCNKLFVPRKNVGDRAKFCKKECCDEFHRHGSAFGPMKLGLYAAIDKKYAALEKEQRRQHRALMSEIADQSRRIDRLEKIGSGFGLDRASSGSLSNALSPTRDRKADEAKKKSHQNF